MAITKFDPFQDFERVPTTIGMLQDTVSRLLSQTTARPWTPHVDVLETQEELVLKADIPGVQMSEIDIRLEKNTLVLQGERKFEEAAVDSGYHRVERAYGSFARYFTLPDTVDAEKVRAEYKNGVLTVTLPKKELAKPRNIKIEVVQ